MDISGAKPIKLFNTSEQLKIKCHLQLKKNQVCIQSGVL